MAMSSARLRRSRRKRRSTSLPCCEARARSTIRIRTRLSRDSHRLSLGYLARDMRIGAAARKAQGQRLADRGLRHILDNGSGGCRHDAVPAIEHALRSQMFEASFEPREASSQRGDAFASFALPAFFDAIERGALSRWRPQEAHECLSAECELAPAQRLVHGRGAGQALRPRADARALG